MEDILKKIIKLRKAKGFTQEKMAEKLFMTRSAYTKLESGLTELAYKKLKLIAEILEVEIEVLIDSKNNQESFVMFIHTYHSLCELMFKAVPYDDLDRKQFLELSKKGIIGRSSYENTPLKGRLYKVGPKDVFRFVVENCGMDYLFKGGMITERFWVSKWKNYKLENNGQQELYELDLHEYFLVYHIQLTFSGEDICYQIAERDFPDFVNESNLIETAKKHTKADTGEIMCYSFEGYDNLSKRLKL